jgi:hypothetical protein
MEKTNTSKIGDTLYIEAPRSKFVPAYVFYLLEYFKCSEVCFGYSKKIYKKENLKGKSTWKDVIKDESK